MWEVNNHRQKGVALVLVMVFLLVMTALGIAGVSRINLDERLVQNNRDLSVAFSAAESGLSDAEQWLQEQSFIPEGVSACANAPCLVWNTDQLGDLSAKSNSWWQANARQMSTSLDDVNSQPRYIVEKTHFIPYELSPDAQSEGKGTHYYKVTARGTGQTDQSQSIVQSVFSVFYN